jgi:hypothetical protein
LEQTSVLSADHNDMTAPDTQQSIIFPGSGLVFLIALAISVSVGIFIQLILLPYVLPAIHAGHGLVQGGDWVGFHADAVAMSENIAREGWRSFELRPRGQTPIGIAAAVYTVTGIKEPWILVPLHGTVFALAVVGLFNIYRRIADVRLARVAAIALVFFPSSALLYAQIHKDAWSLAGTIWLVCALLAYVSLPKVLYRHHLTLLVISTLAMLAVWFVRPYVLQLLLVGFAVAFVFLLVWALFAAEFRFPRQQASRWLGIWLCSIIIYAGAADGPTRLASLISPDFGKLLGPPDVLEGDRPVFTPVMIPPGFEKTLTAEQKILLDGRRFEDLVKTLSPDQLAEWQRWQTFVGNAVAAASPDEGIAPWLPAPLRHRLGTIINLRRGQVLSALSAGSAIDYDASIRNVTDMLRYIPRALQIALFSPFPNMWFQRGVSPGAGPMRGVAGVEMIVCYLLFAGYFPLLFLASHKQRKRFLLVCVFALPILCLLGMTIPNIGTLYRMRYGYFYLLVGLGIIGWGFAVSRLGTSRQRSTELRPVP